MFLQTLARYLCKAFFRNIHLSGTPYVGKSCIWAVNHTSAIVDPAVMFGLAPVQLRPIAKHTLWDHPVMQPLLRTSRAIPVYRLQDMKKELSAERESAEQGIPMSDSRAQQNHQAFEAVSKALHDGDSILIFPEGISHDKPFLQKLRSGIARMALQAVATAADSSFTVIVQPVAIDYFEKDEFRSDVAVHFCEPIPVSSADVDVNDLLTAIQTSLLDGLATFSTWDEKRNWQFIFETAYGRSAHSAREFRVFVENHRWKFEADPVFLARIQTMRRMLLAMNISPSQLIWGETNENKRSFFKLFMTHAWFHFFVSVPIQYISGAMWYLPHRLTAVMASMSVKERDVLATMKVAHGLYIFPLCLGLGSVVWAAIFKWMMPSLTWGFGTALGLVWGIAALFAGTWCAERTDFFPGYWRFARLRFFFPRGWREVMGEWRDISEKTIEKINHPVALITEEQPSGYAKARTA